MPRRAEEYCEGSGMLAALVDELENFVVVIVGRPDGTKKFCRVKIVAAKKIPIAATAAAAATTAAVAAVRGGAPIEGPRGSPAPAGSEHTAVAMEGERDCHTFRQGERSGGVARGVEARRRGGRRTQTPGGL